STLALLEALQQLRFLSSEARLPELRKSCQQSLQQICALTASPEFRARCLEVPPETTLPALEIFAGEEEEAETEPLEAGSFDGPKPKRRLFWRLRRRQVQAEREAPEAGSRADVMRRSCGRTWSRAAHQRCATKRRPQRCTESGS
ncbi:unnamed protein product, partial [Effrenium voratum]